MQFLCYENQFFSENRLESCPKMNKDAKKILLDIKLAIESFILLNFQINRSNLLQTRKKWSLSKLLNLRFPYAYAVNDPMLDLLQNVVKRAIKLCQIAAEIFSNVWLFFSVFFMTFQTKRIRPMKILQNPNDYFQQLRKLKKYFRVSQMIKLF